MIRVCFIVFLLTLINGKLKGELSTNEPKICDPNVQQYSGYFKLNTGKLDKHYFYWFFESRNDPANDPVVLWMTGGPGCSSEVALFGENGPCKVNVNGTDTTNNPYSWNSKANLLYIDQPAGTGFSYGKGMDHDEAGVAVDMYDFLQQFFQTHTKYANLPFYAFGESYAGHYIPAVTHQIWKKNNNLPQGAIHINLNGTAVGNGLTDPEIQYKYYPDMGISTNHHKPVYSKLEYKAMKAIVPICVKAIQNCQTNTTACIGAIDICNGGLVSPYQLTGRNVYDMRIKCAKPPLCYDFSNVATYLSQPSVQRELGTTGHKWSYCNHAVTLLFALSGDWMKNYQTMIPDQLNSGIRVLLYAGDQDYICNWLGNQAWAKALDWPHKTDFNNVPLFNYTAAGKPAGELRTAYGLSFLRVFDAGHMVPLDQPAVALQMLDDFMAGKL